MTFRYWIVVGDIDDDRQVVRLNFQNRSDADAPEFIATEYLYTRRD